MPIGKSRRIVVDVDDIEIKRRLYATLARDGLTLKEWFLRAATRYVEPDRQLRLKLQVAEDAPRYARALSERTEE